MLSLIMASWLWQFDGFNGEGTFFQRNTIGKNYWLMEVIFKDVIRSD